MSKDRNSFGGKFQYYHLHFFIELMIWTRGGHFDLGKDIRVFLPNF